MSRKAFDIPRKDHQDNHIDVFYQEYYSEIDAGSRPVSPSQIYPTNATYSMPRQYHPDTVFNTVPRVNTNGFQKVKNALKKFATSAKKSFAKDTHSSSMKQFGGSVSSLPSPVVHVHGHRRVVSVKPLPSIPNPVAGQPRDLHKRRPTAGPRELPEDLQKIEDQKNRVGGAAAVEKQIRLELDGMVSLLSIYATSPDPRIENAVATKIANIEDQLASLKSTIASIVSAGSPVLRVDVDSTPTQESKSEDEDNKTQVISRSSSSYSLEKLKTLTRGLMKKVSSARPMPEAC